MWGRILRASDAIDKNTIDSDFRSRDFGIQNLQKFGKPAQSGGAQNPDLHPQAVFGFVPGAAAFNMDPGKAVKFFEDGAQGFVDLAKYIGIGHAFRISRTMPAWRFAMSRTKQTLSVFLFVILAVTSTLAQSGNQVAKGTTSNKTTTAPSISNSKPATPPLVDLNTASKKALMELPGISDVNAQKIIENRPYHSKTDLTEKKIITVAAYEKIAKLVVARQTTRVAPGNV